MRKEDYWDWDLPHVLIIGNVQDLIQYKQVMSEQINEIGVTVISE